jgi:hypothetical protein
MIRFGARNSPERSCGHFGARGVARVSWAAAEEVVDIEIGRMEKSATELTEVLKELVTGEVPEMTAATGETVELAAFKDAVVGDPVHAFPVLSSVMAKHPVVSGFASAKIK